MVEEIEKIQEKIEKGIEKQEARVEKVKIKKQAKLEKKLGEQLARSKFEELRKLKKKRLKGFKVSIKARKKAALQAEIGRRKLLQAILKEKKPVNVLARVEDTIPNVLVKRRDEEIKPTFMGKGKLI